MIANSKIRFTDLSRQKRFTTDLTTDLTTRHNVDQAIDFFLDRAGIQDNDLPWAAFSRGVRLEKETLLSDVPDADDQWTVLPTVSAGCATETTAGFVALQIQYLQG